MSWPQAFFFTVVAVCFTAFLITAIRILGGDE